MKVFSLLSSFSCLFSWCVPGEYLLLLRYGNGKSWGRKVEEKEGRNQKGKGDQSQFSAVELLLRCKQLLLPNH